MFAAAGSSLQPIETAVIAGISPTMLRAALTSSSATPPCVMTTMPIMPSPLVHVAMVDPHRVAARVFTAAPIALAIITERCRPPVQPTAIVR